MYNKLVHCPAYFQHAIAIDKSNRDSDTQDSEVDFSGTRDTFQSKK
jgi:hypothetical protein